MKNRQNHLKKIISLAMALIMMGAMVGEVLPQNAYAATLDYIETLKDDKKSESGTFRIVELIPDENQGSIGFYIPGQEPTSGWVNKLETLDTAEKRLSYMEKVEADLVNAGILGTDTKTPLTYTDSFYTEFYPWDTAAMRQFEDKKGITLSPLSLEKNEEGQFPVAHIKGSMEEKVGDGDANKEYLFDVDSSLSRYVYNPDGNLVEDIDYFVYAKAPLSEEAANVFYYKVTFTNAIAEGAELPDNGEKLYTIPEIEVETETEPQENPASDGVDEQSEQVDAQSEQVEENNEVENSVDMNGMEEATDFVLDGAEAEEEALLNGEEAVSEAEEAVAEGEEVVVDEEETNGDEEESVDEGAEADAEEKSEQIPNETEETEDIFEASLTAVAVDEATVSADYYEFYDVFVDDGSVPLDMDVTYYKVESVTPLRDYEPGCYTAVSLGFIESEDGYISLEQDGFIYVGNNGHYALNTSGSQNLDISYSTVNYCFEFTNNDWFAKYVFDMGEDDEMPIEVWPYTPEQLDSHRSALYSADMVVICNGFAPGEDKAATFTEDNDLEVVVDEEGSEIQTEDTLDILTEITMDRASNQCPIMVEAALANSAAVNIRDFVQALYLKYYDASDYAITDYMGGVFHNVYFFDGADLKTPVSSIANGGFVEIEFKDNLKGPTTDEHSTPYGIIPQVIATESAEREISYTKITEASAIRQIIDFPGQFMGNKKDVIRVLMIQPMKQGYVFNGVDIGAGYTAKKDGKKYTGEFAAAEYIRDNFLPDQKNNQFNKPAIEDIQITVETVSILEFVARTDDLIANYDMIYIGSSRDGFQTDDGTLKGQTVFNDPTFRDNKIKLPNGMLYSNVGDRYQSNMNNSYDLKGTTFVTSIDQYRASGNDLTSLRAEELIFFAESGLPVIVEDELYGKGTPIGGGTTPIPHTPNVTVSLDVSYNGSDTFPQAVGAESAYTVKFTANYTASEDLSEKYTVSYDWHYKNPKDRRETEVKNQTEPNREISMQDGGYCYCVVTFTPVRAAGNGFDKYTPVSLTTDTCTFTKESYTDTIEVRVQENFKNEHPETSTDWRGRTTTTYYRDYYYTVTLDPTYGCEPNDFDDLTITYSWSDDHNKNSSVSNTITKSSTYGYNRIAPPNLSCTVTVTGFESTSWGGGKSVTANKNSAKELERTRYFLNKSLASSGAATGDLTTYYTTYEEEARTAYVNYDRVAQGSAMDYFLETIYPRHQQDKNVFLVSEVVANKVVNAEGTQNKVLAWLNKCSCPSMYVTSVGGEAFIETDENTGFEIPRSDDVITLTESALDIRFYLRNPTDPTPVSSRYRFALYIDKDGNGVFSEDEVRDDAVINWGAVSADEMKANQSYTIYLPLDQSDAGIIPWRLELYRVNPSSGETDYYVHATAYGFCYYEPKEVDSISVLQIVSYDDSTRVRLNKTETDKTNWVSSTFAGRNDGYLTNKTYRYYSVTPDSPLFDPNGYFCKLVNGTVTTSSSPTYVESKDNAVWTNCDRVVRDYLNTIHGYDHYFDLNEYYSKTLTGSVKFGDTKLYDITMTLVNVGQVKSYDDLKDYDVILLGSGEGFDGLCDNAVKGLRKYIQEDKKAVVCTHDTFSAVSEKAAGKAIGGQIIEEYISDGIDDTYYSREYFANGYTLPDGTKDVGLRKAFCLTNDDQTATRTDNVFLRWLANRDLYRSNTNISAGFTRNTIIRHLKLDAASSGGSAFRRFIDNIRKIYEQIIGDYDANFVEPDNSLAAHTNIVTQVNVGRPTSYPYNLNTDQNIVVSDTFEPYYCLELDTNNANVWYCLDGDFYKDAMNDAVNCYYMFSVDNIYYIGTNLKRTVTKTVVESGLTKGGDYSVKYYQIADNYTSDEAKMLINCIVAAYHTSKSMGGNTDDEDKTPTVNFLADNRANAEIITSFFVPVDTSGDSAAFVDSLIKNDSQVYFRINRPEDLDAGVKYIVTIMDGDTDITNWFDITLDGVSQKKSGEPYFVLEAGKTYALVLAKAGDTNSALAKLLSSTNLSNTITLIATPDITGGIPSVGAELNVRAYSMFKLD